MKKPSLTVIFPCYHQPKTVIETGIRDIQMLAKKEKWDVTFIVAQNGDPKPYKFSPNRVTTQFTPIKTFGLSVQKALQTINTDWFYLTSPDNPFHLTDLKTMLKQARGKSGPDYMIGSKLHAQSQYQGKFLRKLMSYIFNLIVSLIFPNFPIKDPNGSHFARVAHFRSIYPNLKRKNFSICVELIWRYHRKGARFLEIPVTYQNRKNQKSSVRIIKDSLYYVVDLLLIRFS